MESNKRNDFTLEGRLVSNRQVNRIHVQNGLIIGVEPVVGIRDDTELPWIGPGLIDMQINGYSGIDFNTDSLTEDDVIKVTRLLWKQGVTSYLPTVITNSDEAIKRGVAAIARARTMDAMTQASIPGIHLEGPFLSPYDGPRGAHEEQYIQDRIGMYSKAGRLQRKEQFE